MNTTETYVILSFKFVKHFGNRCNTHAFDGMKCFGNRFPYIITMYYG